jgi:hypothetical protein
MDFASQITNIKRLLPLNEYLLYSTYQKKTYVVAELNSMQNKFVLLILGLAGLG